MRPPVDRIEAPPFPPRLKWINSEPLSVASGRPMLLEFWDFCRPNSLRTLPYVKAWHERYALSGLQVVGVHASGFEPSGDPDAVRAAVSRLGIDYPVLIDQQLETWQLYGNLGWPARYLFDERGRLFDYHYGEGAYDETELAIQEVLGSAQPTLAPLRPEDVPGAQLAPQSADVAGPYSGPYEAGGVWAVLSGEGRVVLDGREIEVTHPGAYELIAHPVSVRAMLELEFSGSVVCHAVCFTPGLAAAASPAG